LHISLALGWFIYFSYKVLQMHCNSKEDYLLTNFSRKTPQMKMLKNLFFLLNIFKSPVLMRYIWMLNYASSMTLYKEDLGCEINYSAR